MKATLVVVPLLVILSTSAFANDQIKKLQTIKSMYSEILHPYDDTPDIYKHSNRDFQNIIALAVADMPDYTLRVGNATDCSYERAYHLNLIPVDDLELVDVHYLSLKNGNVRAVMEYSNYSASDLYFDFSLECKAYENTCKITDMINHHGSSASAAIERKCR